MIEPSDYASWNDMLPMRIYLEELDPGKNIVEGKGVHVRDGEGRWYLDARAGLWNVTLGYDAVRVRDAIKRQLDVLPFANASRYERSTDVVVEYANALAKKLPEGVRRIRFVNTGAQATECAAMLSRFVRRVEGRPERTAIFALWHGFHGIGAGAGALTGEEYLHYSCGPIMPDVHHADPPSSGSDDASALEDAMRAYGPERITAVFLEPILGTGAIVLARPYLERIADFCAEHGIHLVFDEITTGLGRVGAYTRAEQLGVVPDMIALSKGMTSGYVPAGALAVGETIWNELFDIPRDAPFVHGATTDGHVLAMAAGLAVLETIDEDGILANVQEQGRRLEAGLRALADEHEELVDVRGAGLMYGLEFAEPDGALWGGDLLNDVRLAAEERGVLVAVVEEGHCLMLMPPLVVTHEHVDTIVDVLDEAIADVASRSRVAARAGG